MREEKDESRTRRIGGGREGGRIKEEDKCEREEEKRSKRGRGKY